MNARWLGTVDYLDALELQREAHAAVRGGGEDVILGLEHPPVITLGIRGRPAEDLLVHEGFQVVRADRGGQATLHSPGQLVIYPIIDLRRRGLSPRSFVQKILGTTAEILARNGIEASARESAAGVYTTGGKMAFCGLRIERGVSRHGLSLNVSNDLSLFRAIRPCGRREESLVSWETFRKAPELPDLFADWVGNFNA